MLRRLLIVSGAVTVALAALVGIEIVLALRREYLPTAPAMRIEGTFGAPESQPLRFVVLGDSTAAGLGADSADDAYPSVLARKLAADGYRVHLTGLGISGARVRDLLEEQVPEAVASSPDLIFVGIGANDVTHLTPLDEIGRDIARALERLLESGATVVVAGPPDMHVFAWAEPLRSLSAWRGRAVAARIEEAARAAAVPVVQLAEETGPRFTEDPVRYHSADEFHPSSDGYALWADAIYPVLERALQER
ncbi:MAG: SGNH/GDSL hydrolase family protein [Actinomycetota bacterium]